MHVRVQFVTPSALALFQAKQTGLANVHSCLAGGQAQTPVFALGRFCFCSHLANFTGLEAAAFQIFKVPSLLVVVTLLPQEAETGHRSATESTLAALPSGEKAAHSTAKLCLGARNVPLGHEHGAHGD